ncbi:transposase [Dissulfurirhabdus thermomarina]|uniref:Transposase n=1 Tax=Dissulfurirhabdus thermomarina TaxID=1765737 RepID=A0A6N9TUA3_DISTH|nr:transposase [Dissulfurirhabdus thermomarina]NMX23476.1 transposase [Dissulfurirhabdus thermomarina]
MQYLKYTYNLSDDDVVVGWVENPYWQYLSGMQYFEYEAPIHPSSMSRWRKRIGEAGAEQLLKETIAAGLKLKVVRPHQLKRVNVDTTVQEKDIRFPTDARLYHRARRRLVDAAKKRKIPLRQNYNRIGRGLFFQQSRYAHARQMKRAAKCIRKLRTILGRVIRDIERKCSHPDEQLRLLLDIARRIFNQQRNDKNKIYLKEKRKAGLVTKPLTPPEAKGGK